MTLSDRASLRSVYLYLICLVTLIMTIFAVVSVVRNVVELAYPDPGYHGFEPAYAPGPALLIAVPGHLYHCRRLQEELSGGRRSAATTDQPLS